MAFLRLVVALTCLALCSGSAQAQQRTPDEYALMAVYTYNFAKFTEWPSGSLSTPSAPLNFCILGEDPFGVALTKIEGKQVKRHQLRIKRYPRVAIISGCHIVFISRSEDWRLEAILQDLASSPVLTVSDIPDFAQRGGMIALKTVKQKVRFSINPAIAARAGLRLSSKLLELAQIVSNG